MNKLQHYLTTFLLFFCGCHCSPFLRDDDGQKFGLELRYATNIVEEPVYDGPDNPEHLRPTKGKVCHLSSKIKHRICNDAVKTAYCQRTGFVFLESRSVQSEKNYSITYGGRYNYDIPPQIEPACMCPTIPPLYLKDGSIPGVVTVIIDGEVASALENSI